MITFDIVTTYHLSVTRVLYLTSLNTNRISYISPGHLKVGGKSSVKVMHLLQHCIYVWHHIGTSEQKHQSTSSCWQSSPPGRQTRCSDSVILRVPNDVRTFSWFYIYFSEDFLLSCSTCSISLTILNKTILDGNVLKNERT